ncbi:MAG: DUF3201 domain-containing protein [Candidatus Thorarchaeota archaeon]
MEELKIFAKENKKKIHDLLNHMWRTIERLHVRLEAIIPSPDLENAHGNFIKLQDGWDEAAYANPEIIFPYGEIGYSLDGLYCVYSLNPIKITEKLLADILVIINKNNELMLEIYGADDCFQTFYHSQEEMALDETLASIRNTKEDLIQLELSIEPLADEDIKEAFVESIISLYDLFFQNNCLVKLPNYD